jgi:cyclophilin family peptidyl-prolyl cis-trans isomerase
LEEKVKTRLNLFLAASVAGILAFSASSCSKPKYPEGLYAELQTNKGLIVLQLEFEKTPMTVANFVGLAEGTIDNSALPPGIPFYDGVEFHRVVPGHVIQAGIPKEAKDRGPGYTFPNEIFPGLSHGREGMLGMANGGPHTNSSQFYITLGDRSYLDGDYTVFGQVVEGMDVVSAIVQGDVIENTAIVRVGKKVRRFKSDTESFEKLVDEARKRVKDAEEAKQQREDEIIQANWPQALTTESGLKYVVIQEGQGEKLETGITITVQFTGQTIDGGKSFSSDAQGSPSPDQEAAPFEYKIGETRLTPAINEALADMKKGGKRILIVPPPLGFGSGGYYGRSIEGQKRFVISPNTTLVIELTVLN